MKSFVEVKKEKEKKYSELIENCEMFFAFSNEQFEKNKTPKAEDEKYVSFGDGSYLPKSNLDKWFDGIKMIKLWEVNATKNAIIQEEEILYQLINHEAFYVGNIEDTYNALDSRYTHEQIWQVYNKNKSKNQ